MQNVRLIRSINYTNSSSSSSVYIPNDRRNSKNTKYQRELYEYIGKQPNKSLLKMVWKVAQKYSRAYRVEFLPLYSACYMAIDKARGMYDETKGTKFSTYCYIWMQNYAQKEAIFLKSLRSTYAQLEDYIIEGESFGTDEIDTNLIEDFFNGVEAEVAKLLIQGHTQTDICEKLDLTIFKISSIKDKIKERLTYIAEIKEEIQEEIEDEENS